MGLTPSKFIKRTCIRSRDDAETLLVNLLDLDLWLARKSHVAHYDPADVELLGYLSRISAELITVITGAGDRCDQLRLELGAPVTDAREALKLLFRAIRYILADPKLVVVRCLRRLRVYSQKDVDAIGKGDIHRDIMNEVVAKRDSLVPFGDIVNWTELVDYWTSRLCAGYAHAPQLDSWDVVNVVSC